MVDISTDLGLHSLLKDDPKLKQLRLIILEWRERNWVLHQLDQMIQIIRSNPFKTKYAVVNIQPIKETPIFICIDQIKQFTYIDDTHRFVCTNDVHGRYLSSTLANQMSDIEFDRVDSIRP